ncbi:hypothetical protein [Cellulosilyticum ruminicola]|uniref:hypothetical protein n=1 Tax=Cellulosilyticum ruminicola TaxID=425254 RepID=UPI0006D0811D|nr:hypothetical protein [Cellulosilyticum ruminicola]
MNKQNILILLCLLLITNQLTVYASILPPTVQQNTFYLVDNQTLNDSPTSVTTTSESISVIIELEDSPLLEYDFVQEDTLVSFLNSSLEKNYLLKF